VHLLYAGSALCAAVPLIEETWPARSFVSVDNEHTPVFAFALDPGVPGADGALLEYLLDHADVLFLRRFPLEGVLSQRLEQAAGARRLRVARIEHSDSGDSFIKVVRPWEAQLDAWPRGLSAETKRRMRRLTEMGTVSLERVDGGAGLEVALAECFELETRGWKSVSGSPIKSDTRTMRFYTDLAREATGAGIFCLYQLKLNGSLIAFDYVLRSGGRLDSLKISYEPSLAHTGPGNVLRWLVVKQEVERGEIETFHFGRPTPLKRRWSSDVGSLGTLRIYASSPRGLLAYYGGPVLRGMLKRKLPVERMKSWAARVRGGGDSSRLPSTKVPASSALRAR
jgi:hypothetical protein